MVRDLGTAVYVVCILTGSAASPDGNTDMTFMLDGKDVGSFEKAPDGDATYHFNQTVFSATGLSNSSHTLQVQSGHAGQKALILLDAVVYTADDGIDNIDGGSSVVSSSSVPLSSTSRASGTSSIITTSARLTTISGGSSPNASPTLNNGGSSTSTTTNSPSSTTSQSAATGLCNSVNAVSSAAGAFAFGLLSAFLL